MTGNTWLIQPARLDWLTGRITPYPSIWIQVSEYATNQELTFRGYSMGSILGPMLNEIRESESYLGPLPAAVRGKRRGE